ncbi:putative TetR-family regulatory protein [Longimycelium tulufanense]|uniref:Putative TetR-family regulatory protein n=1 Tax=Longimycelium tulufanense TaxID=907463 RepID=A0A8J3CDG4_9PSEU|nr:TetR/AcrR family transcriptional regulator [Longimycelium tulufanense]GGM49930.1 putative TetR-family regulatory protein [Longimycelium tulufanense]
MPKGPTKRRPETLARLLDAALDVFAERSFYGASIEEICDRAGYTRGAFYSNFTSKEELFLALFDRHSKQTLDDLTEALVRATNATDPGKALTEWASVRDPDERRWYLVSTEFSLYAARNPETAARLAEHEAQVRDRIVRILELLFEHIGAKPPVDLVMVARLATAIREGGILQSLVEPDELPVGELERQFLPLFVRAVTAGIR